MEGKYIPIQKRGESSHFVIQEYLIDLVIIAVANNQITRACAKILMQAVVMVVYGSRID